MCGGDLVQTLEVYGPGAGSETGFTGCAGE